LADWLRDLSSGQVPDYLQEHWQNHRIPANLDFIVHQALDAEAALERDLADDEAGEEPVKPRRGAKPALKLVGKKRAAKKPRTKSDEHEAMLAEGEAGKPADEQLNAFSIPIKESAVDALRDGKMGDKMRWQRVYRYVKALMADYGFRFRTTPKRQSEEPKPGMSLVTFFIEERDDGPKTDLAGFIKHMERTFGNAFDSYEQSDEPDEQVRFFKVWFKHA
jgi:hypothetical protein